MSEQAKPLTRGIEWERMCVGSKWTEEGVTYTFNEEMAVLSVREFKRVEATIDALKAQLSAEEKCKDKLVALVDEKMADLNEALEIIDFGLSDEADVSILDRAKTLRRKHGRLK